MKRFRWIFVLVLAAVVLFTAPAQVLAAAQVSYLSDIRLGYGDEGKASLEAEGFKVWTDLNANDGGNGSAVWLGYKTTEDKNEAITDVALMNMKGGYSFDGYLEELADLNRQVTEQLANFKASIEEFRENYDAGSVFAVQARESMNLFTEDDTLDADGDPMPIGDVIYDENTPVETLHRIFLEGNTEAVYAIEQALAVACIELGDDNVLSRLEETEYPDKLDPAGNTGRTNLKTAFPDFRSAAIEAKNAYEIAENYEGGMDAFLERDDLSEDDAAAYAARFVYYDILSSIMLGDSGMTLLEFALLDEEEPDANGEVLEDEYLDMMAQAMTPGQLGIVSNVGIMAIIMNAVAGENHEEAEDVFEENAVEAEPASVYLGVDRTLFEETGGIALTSAAYREKAAAEQSDFGKDSATDKTEAKIFTAAAAGCAAIGAVALGLGLRIYYVTAGFKYSSYQVMANGALKVWSGAAPSAATTVGGILGITVGIIAIIASVVLTIISILKWREKPYVPKTEYTEIPRVIVEKPDEGGFIAYYVARLAGASENETDTTKLYGDLNALNTMDEWVALYYSKNPTVGTPLTADMIVSDSNILTASKADSYSPAHMFGTDLAANLNQYNTRSGAKQIYIFFRHAEETSQTASVFASGSTVMSIITFLCGAGIAAAATYIAMKKRSEKKEAAA